MSTPVQMLVYVHQVFKSTEISDTIGQNYLSIVHAAQIYTNKCLSIESPRNPLLGPLFFSPSNKAKFSAEKDKQGLIHLDNTFSFKYFSAHVVFSSSSRPVTSNETCLVGRRGQCQNPIKTRWERMRLTPSSVSSTHQVFTLASCPLGVSVAAEMHVSGMRSVGTLGALTQVVKVEVTRAGRR